MKLKFEVVAKEVPLFKKIVSDLKKIAQAGEFYMTFDNDQISFHNYFNFDQFQGLLYFLKIFPDAALLNFTIQSQKPNNHISIKFKDEISKFNSAVSNIPDSKVPVFYLGKEDDKKYLKMKHEIQSGISSVESKIEIDVLAEPQEEFPTFDNKKIELLVPLKSFIPFLEEGNTLESPVILKIFDVGETASVSLKVKNNGYKVNFSMLSIIHKAENLDSSFSYNHLLSPRVLKPLSSACGLSEFGILTLFEDNFLGVVLQHMGKEEGQLTLRAQELMIIPELAVQE